MVGARSVIDSTPLEERAHANSKEYALQLQGTCTFHFKEYARVNSEGKLQGIPRNMHVSIQGICTYSFRGKNARNFKEYARFNL
jgi:hypothetical protein